MPDPAEKSGSFGSPKDSPIASGERMVGLTAVFEELQNNFQSLLSNPAASGYAFYKLGRMIDDNLTKNLRSANAENKEFIKHLDDLQGKDVLALKLGAAIGGIAMKVTALTGELKKAGLEFNRFANLSQLPGGAGGSARTVTDIRLGALNYNQGNIGGFGVPTGGNEAFREAYGKAYTDLFRQLQYFNVSGGARQELSATLARYQVGLGVNGGDLMQDLMQNYAGRGMTLQNSKNIVDAIAYGANAPGNPFGFVRPDQLGQMFGQVMPGIVSSGTNPVMAAEQTFRLFGALGRQGGGVNGNTLGANEISGLSGTVVNIMKDATARLSLQKLTGGRDLETGGAGGGVNILSRLQEFLQNVSGGRQISNLSELQKTNMRGYGYIKELEGPLGLTDEQAVMLNNMPKITDGINSISKALEDATKNGKAFGSEAGSGFKQFNDDLQAAIANSQTGLEFLSAEGRKIMLYASQVAQRLGIPQIGMDIATMGLGAAAQIAIGAAPFYFGNKFAMGKSVSGLTKAITQMSTTISPGAVASEFAGTGLADAKMTAMALASDNTGAFGNVVGGEGALSIVQGGRANAGFSNIPGVGWWGKRNAPLLRGKGGFGWNASTMISGGLLAYNAGSLANKVYKGQHLGEEGLIEGMQGVADIAGMFGGPIGMGAALLAQVEPSLIKGIYGLFTPSEDQNHREFVNKVSKNLYRGGSISMDQARSQAEMNWQAAHGGNKEAKDQVNQEAGVVNVIFSNDQGQQLGSTLAAPGTQTMIRIYSSMMNVA